MNLRFLDAPILFFGCKMEVEVALRVVRGPDWHYGDEDGGEGYVGSVILTETGENGSSAVVIWDNGNRGSYSCGVGGKYDLRVLDSSPAGKLLPQSCTLISIKRFMLFSQKDLKYL